MADDSIRQSKTLRIPPFYHAFPSLIDRSDILRYIGRLLCYAPSIMRTLLGRKDGNWQEGTPRARPEARD